MSGLGTGGGRLSRGLGRHHAARAEGHAGGMAQRRDAGGTTGRAAGTGSRSAATSATGSGSRSAASSATGSGSRSAARAATGSGSRTAARAATGTRADGGGPASGGDSVAAATAGARDLRLIRFAVETPHGSAEVALELPKAALGLLILGHGASGSVDAPDLAAVRDAAVAVRLAVARITQPYRVQGRRAPPPAAQLDAAWIAAITETRRRAGAKLPIVVGGRSS